MPVRIHTYRANIHTVLESTLESTPYVHDFSSDVSQVKYMRVNTVAL